MAGRDPGRSFREYDKAYPIRLGVRVGHQNYGEKQGWLRDRADELFGKHSYEFAFGPTKSLSGEPNWPLRS